MQTNEFVSLVASFHSTNEETVDFTAKGYSPEQIAALQAAMPSHISSETLGLVFKQPFTNFKDSNFSYCAFLYNQFDKFGTLPFQGCLTEQPNKIIEIFNVIKALVQEQIQKQEAKYSKKSKK